MSPKNKFQIYRLINAIGQATLSEPNVYPTILGGVSRGFWSPFEDSDAQSAKMASSGIYGSINLKLVFWALITTLKLPWEAGKPKPIFWGVQATGDSIAEGWMSKVKLHRLYFVIVFPFFVFVFVFVPVLVSV